MRKFIYWTTIASGVAAAYLMLRRGESLSTVARQTLAHPISTLISEVQNTV